MSKMGDYVIWLEERGYTEWDEKLDGYVFVDGVDTTKTMKEYRKEQREIAKNNNKRNNNANSG